MFYLGRFFEWDKTNSAETHKLGLKTSEKDLGKLEDVGQQLALVFNKDGSALAAGGEVQSHYCHFIIKCIFSSWQ